MSRDQTPLDKVAELLSIARFQRTEPGEELADAIDKLVRWRIEQAISGMPLHVHGRGITLPEVLANVRLAWDRGDEGFHHDEG